MVRNQNRNDQQDALKPVNMYVWRLMRKEAQKHEDDVHRELLHRLKH